MMYIFPFSHQHTQRTCDVMYYTFDKNDFMKQYTQLLFPLPKDLLFEIVGYLFIKSIPNSHDVVYSHKMERIFSITEMELNSILIIGQLESQFYFRFYQSQYGGTFLTTFVYFNELLKELTENEYKQFILFQQQLQGGLLSKQQYRWHLRSIPHILKLEEV